VRQDHLGLFDTPPSRKQTRFSVVVVCVLLAALVFTLTVRDIRLGPIDAFIPMIDAVTSLVDLIIATLLYVQASVFRSRGLTALASGYVFTALILIPHALTFPGAFAPSGLLGAGTSTTAWLYMFWRAALPIAVFLYAVLDRDDAPAVPELEQTPASAAIGVLTAVALAAAATLLAIKGQNVLPALYLNHSEANYDNILMVSATLMVPFFAALGMLLRRRKSVLDIWLLIVLAAWLIQTALLQSLEGRFTANWYFAVVVVLVSHLFLMIALIAESSRLYARLALSTAARDREREARLLSMDGVTAAISHEVGQPLTAVNLSAKAGLDWLTRDTPNPEKAIEALRATIDAGKRTSDIIRSIRRTFAKVPGTATLFSLNDVVRETASLSDREMAAAGISLELDLDEALPLVVADRVQIQRVVVNLLTNAIESLAATRMRSRRIFIRSMRDGGNVLVEVSDNGVGIAPEELEHIFDVFFTTKATGTGLGLALCRTIVEDHGGRLWASEREEYGATFRLQLPRSNALGHGNVNSNE
jgi:signal transduction histidine kinase